jgi:hypothetical protein
MMEQRRQNQLALGFFSYLRSIFRKIGNSFQDLGSATFAK